MIQMITSFAHDVLNNINGGHQQNYPFRGGGGKAPNYQNDHHEISNFKRENISSDIHAYTSFSNYMFEWFRMKEHRSQLFIQYINCNLILIFNH